MKTLLAFLLMVTVAHATQGDINGDGLVGLGEAVYALQVSAGLKPQPGREIVHCSGSSDGGLILDRCGICGGSGAICCEDQKKSISGTISSANSFPLTFNLSADGEQYIMIASNGFSLKNDWRTGKNYYEITAEASNGSFFRLRLPENVASGNTYTDPGTTDELFTLYFWDDTNNNNMYTYKNGHTGSISIVVSAWDTLNNTVDLTFTSETLYVFECSMPWFKINVNIHNFPIIASSTQFLLKFQNILHSEDNNQTGGYITICGNSGNSTFNSGHDMTPGESYTVTLYQDLNENYNLDAGELSSVITNFIYDGSNPQSLQFNNWN